MSASTRDALIIFAKCPSAGRVKTRLIPALTAEGAAELYRCMLHDIVARTGERGLDRFLFYGDDPGAADYFGGFTGLTGCLPQQGGDLGERMGEAFGRVFAYGYHAAAIIGTDSPDLPLCYIDAAYRLLRQPGQEVVIGPSEDGGYYLLGLNRLRHSLFRGVRWSTASVLGKTLENAENDGIKVELLPQWYDVDSDRDLVRTGLRAPDNGAPLTRQFVSQWLQLQGRAT